MHEGGQLEKVLVFVRTASKTLSKSPDFWLRKYSSAQRLLPHGFAAWKDSQVVAFVGTLEDTLSLNGQSHPVAWCVDWEATRSSPGAGAAVLDFAVRRYRDVAFMTLGGRRAGRQVLEAMGWKPMCHLSRFEIDLSWSKAAKRTVGELGARSARNWARWLTSPRTVGRRANSGAATATLQTGSSGLADLTYADARKLFTKLDCSFDRDRERYQRQYFLGGEGLFKVSVAKVGGRPVGLLHWLVSEKGQQRICHLADWMGTLDPALLGSVVSSIVGISRRLGCDSVEAAFSDGGWHHALLGNGFRQLTDLHLYVEPAASRRLQRLDDVYLTPHDCDLSYTYLKASY